MHCLIMGGYMNADQEDQFPWLGQDKAFIKTAIEEGKKVIGICLGAQLVAAALGAKVYANEEKEIGFFAC
jgi:GMP synthase-like glutamine amidotransferase